MPDTVISALRIETPRLILRVPNLTDTDAVQHAKEHVWDELQKWMP